MTEKIHSCSYYCDRPECIKAQRDELRDQMDAKCTWTCDDDEYMPNTWDGSCGAKWTFTVGGPTENNMHHCPQCGRRVEVDAAKKATK